jgi:uncharacterized protein DUF1707
MTETLEPRHVGPVAGGHLRASDSDRDQVANVLDSAFAEGRLSRDEHDERIESLLHAKTFDDLVGLTRDLVVVASPTTPVPAPTTTSYAVDPSVASAEIDRMVGIFGGAERKGKWRIRRQTETYALFGGIDLDLREAVFESQVVEIRGFWCFGGMEIKVPAGVEVRDQTSGIFGGTDVKDLGDPQPGAPVIVLKGVSLFGGVSVRGPKPSRKRGQSALGRGHGCGRH